MEPSSVTGILFQQLNYRGEKQKIISSNIANIDTPDFKTKDLRFKNLLDKSDETYKLKMATTHQNHMIFEEDEQTSNLKRFEVQGLPEQNDGNNVNIDNQMAEMSKNSILFKAIQSSIKKDSTWFKSIIDASSKN